MSMKGRAAETARPIAITPQYSPDPVAREVRVHDQRVRIVALLAREIRSGALLALGDARSNEPADEAHRQGSVRREVE